MREVTKEEGRGGKERVKEEEKRREEEGGPQNILKKIPQRVEEE